MHQDIIYTRDTALEIAAEYRAQPSKWDTQEDEKGAGGFWDFAQELATHSVPDIYGDNAAIDAQVTEIEQRQKLIYTALVAAATGIKKTIAY